MLRQIHIFYEKRHIFTMDFALALGNEELMNVIEVIKSFISLPVSGKTFTRPMSNYQVFHRAAGALYFLFITDLVDSLEQVDAIIIKTISKFNELFPDPASISKSSEAKTIFIKFLNQLQQELHSKIAIVGPLNSGKTTLYDLLRNNAPERTIMNIAKISPFYIDDLSFDIWDFQLLDNFSLLWNKQVSGADLIILLFDLSNYNFKVINHFFTLQKTESKLARLLILANKRDLVSEEEIQKINKELEISAVYNICLTSPDAKSRVISLIRNVLELKNKLPDNFKALLDVAENLTASGQNVSAIAKYKELLNICNTYQDYSYPDAIQQKIKELQLKVNEEVKSRKGKIVKEEFEIPNHIKFAKKVKVKSLPIKEIQAMFSRQPESLTKKSNRKKLSLTPNDFKTDLAALESVKIEEKRTKKIKNIAKLEKEIVQPVTIEEFENFKSKMDFVKALQRMIAFKGSYLSLKLCEQYLKELQDSFDKSLTYEELNLAAETFVNTENKR